MPNKCSVVGCGATKNINQPNITFHRLPRNEYKKRIWLEAIGKENLRTNTKDIFICSQHFDENAFNRTLDILRLRDDAVPTLFQNYQTSDQHQPSTSSNAESSSGNRCDTGLGDILRQVHHLQEKVTGQKKKIKCLNETVRRQRIKIETYQQIIKKLKQENMVTHENCIALEQCAGPKDLMLRQISKSKGLPVERQYSEEVRKFALTLNFLSPRAYDFVRSEYDCCLPHRRTLSKWYQSVEVEPGFCKEAFDALKAKAECSAIPVVCALVFDEMSIRKSLCWDPTLKKYSGRVDIGLENESDTSEVASQCLVFLVNCVNGKWKLPVGYFFITNLSGEQKAALVQTCLYKCQEAGIKIVSITCDGPAANFCMFERLGCNLLEDQTNTSFMCNSDVIHCFIDPCHAIKLIRNTFGELKLLYDIYGRQINFDFIERLWKLQESEGLHMGTKITKAHLYFTKQKMKVRLATQLLSNSVADALEFCNVELQLSSFRDCEGTINFIRIMNDVFDVLNSCSIRPPGWNKAICQENFGLVEALFEGAIGYIQKLKFPSGDLVVKSRRKTGFIGLIVNMRSSLDLFRHLVMETQILKYLPLYKISQDHVELLFSAIRARGGFNNNPNVIQFRAAFKRLLVRAQLRDGGLGNCIPLEQINILSIPSTKNPVKTINDLTSKKSLIEVPEDDSSLFDEYIDCLNNTLSKYSESVVTYIAGFVARKLSRNIKCVTCVSMLFGDSSAHGRSLIKYKTRGGLVYPSKDVECLCKKAEKLLKSNFGKEKFENYYLYIFSFIVEHFGESKDAFSSNSSEHDASHKYLLMKSVLQTYMDLRFRYFGKKCTEKLSFRNYLNKIILFRNE
uniref:THAP-type domain-containing protein n=1 Tax=Heliothis virescens TaxID=7102 RepID=A0A2A4JJZ8_HELVI